MNGQIISLRNVHKSYAIGGKQVEVLNDLNINVEDGEFLALMGPSGSGKSTLLNLVSGLDRPNSGSVLVAGTRVDQLGAQDLNRWRSKHIGFVFQFYNLLPLLNALENVELPLLLTSLSRSKRRENALIALNLVGIQERALHRPGELSGGQQQRVAIARALVSDAPILVCDEPTGDLDRQSAVEILGLLRLLNDDFGKTILIVTHDPLAASYARRHLRLEKGQLSPVMSNAA